MRIKLNNSVYEIESFEVQVATDHKTVDGFLRIDGGIWKEFYADPEESRDSYTIIGRFNFGKYKDDPTLEKALKKADIISRKMLTDGYIDISEYDNFIIE